ncbi:MAG: GGDEF domain-containing phosphodiesterase [Candidatus Borkfalkiaceae bacterium]|nr:GGDEF domain-containing phosphodiesterase [Clostridia bacterium]MDY6222568.1 GGDEF domain-containing phosphodiesterase [Christensenellaceae bacterium]
MHKFFSKYGKAVLISLIALASAVLLIAAVFMLINYSDDISVRATAEAQKRTLKAKSHVYEKLTENTSGAISLAILLSDCDDEVEAYGVISDALQKSEFSEVRFVRYFSGDVLYSENGAEYTGTDSSREHRGATPNEPGYTGVFNDEIYNMSVAGFYAPVTGSSFVDAVVVYYPRNKLSSFYSADAVTADADFSVLALDNEKTEILAGGEDLPSFSLKDSLRTMTGEVDGVNEALKLIHGGEDGTVKVTIDTAEYVVSVCADKTKLKDLSLAELYRIDNLCAVDFDIVDTIIMIMILFAMVTVLIIVYLIVRRVRREKEFFNMQTSDVKLQCLNRRGFEELASEILARNNVTTSFYVISMHLKHYKHIKDSFGEAEISRLLFHLKTAIAKIIGIEETFGHCVDGDFVLLLHAKDRDGLIARLKTLSYLAHQYKSAHKFDIILKYGIFERVQSEDLTIQQAIDFAYEANDAISQATAQDANMQFNFYSSELSNIRLLNEDMELRMEGALKNGEFQIFYQPKYNLRVGRQDGCEALVRWYDAKTGKFNAPALFLRLFETNGFIVKLDKYVYKKVCEYISYTIAHGGTVYPVSVNVSRITAVQPDFVEYYYNTKRKYGISDGLIMIEFTESFAYEDYATLRKIVDGLHRRGFKCSIDDFGCGYSSYRILKSLPMDEIKLDKFFLERSDSESRDDAIFSSIIQLAKNLGMKVTQEGVETKEDLERLIALGCDTVQGYYYSYPLPLSDYIIFVANSNKHNIT